MHLADAEHRRHDRHKDDQGETQKSLAGALCYGVDGANDFYRTPSGLGEFHIFLAKLSIMKKLVCLLVLPVLFLLTAFTHRTISWVAIGDSITYLNDHTDETGNRLTKGYLTQVTQRLPYIHYTNQGHNGWTSAKIAKAIEKMGVPPADVYSVFLGTNDWWHSNHIGSWSDY